MYWRYVRVYIGLCNGQWELELGRVSLTRVKKDKERREWRTWAWPCFKVPVMVFALWPLVSSRRQRRHSALQPLSKAHLICNIDNDTRYMSLPLSLSFLSFSYMSLPLSLSHTCPYLYLSLSSSYMSQPLSLSFSYMSLPLSLFVIHNVALSHKTFSRYWRKERKNDKKHTRRRQRRRRRPHSRAQQRLRGLQHTHAGTRSRTDCSNSLSSRRTVQR